MGGVDMEAAESLFECLEQVADPRRARGVRHPFQAILRLTLLGLVCGQTTMAHIALFARMHWPALREPLGFLRDHPPHATTISRTLAGVPYEQLQGALTGWVARVVADQELDVSVDGKWAKQSQDKGGNPLVMVNVLAHDLRLCLAQWPASEKRHEPGVLREQLDSTAHSGSRSPTTRIRATSTPSPSWPPTGQWARRAAACSYATPT